jgi:hypothetical protein
MIALVALLGLLLLSSLGAALSLTATTEMMIAANDRRAHEGLYAAEAMVERALADLRREADWDALPAGARLSTFADGAAEGRRRLPDGSVLDLDQQRSLLNCGRRFSCAASDIRAATAARPWGAQNPVWRLYAYGPLSALGLSSSSPFYGLVFVADDPGRVPDALWVQGQVFGPAGARHTVEVAIAKDGADVRLLSWRDLR